TATYVDPDMNSIQFMYSFTSTHARFSFFCVNDSPTTEISTLSLHDALPIYSALKRGAITTEQAHERVTLVAERQAALVRTRPPRSEEHTSELQSPYDLVCRLLLEKKKQPSTAA